MQAEMIKPDVSEVYIARCYKKLKEMDAPLDGWHCNGVTDLADEEDVECIAYATCELCGCSQVRYVHHMEHEAFDGKLDVGCICAGVMEGDIIKAKERERLIENRYWRKQTFIHKGWTRNGQMYVRHYHYQIYRIYMADSEPPHYGVDYKGKCRWICQGKPMYSFAQAAAALFHTIDPPVEV